MHSKFARVIIDRAIRRELDYAIPELLSDRVSVGARVRVPFRDRRALATVVALLEQTNAKGVREIEALIGEGPTLSEPLLELARWISNYYCCPIETVMRSLLPQVIRKAEVGWKKQQFVELGAEQSPDTIDDATATRAAPGRTAGRVEEGERATARRRNFASIVAPQCHDASGIGETRAGENHSNAQSCATHTPVRNLSRRRS